MQYLCEVMNVMGELSAHIIYSLSTIYSIDHKAIAGQLMVVDKNLFVVGLLLDDSLSLS